MIKVILSFRAYIINSQLFDFDIINNYNAKSGCYIKNSIRMLKLKQIAAWNQSGTP